MNEQEVLNPVTGELMSMKAACDWLADLWAARGEDDAVVQALDANIESAKAGRGAGTERAAL